MGGKAIGCTFPGLENDATFCKLSIGSLELECFTALKQIINKPWMDTFNVTQTIEIGRVEPGLTTGDILRELGGYTSHDVLDIAKCDMRAKEDRWDRWLLLVNTDKSTGRTTQYQQTGFQRGGLTLYGGPRLLREMLITPAASPRSPGTLMDARCRKKQSLPM